MGFGSPVNITNRLDGAFWGTGFYQRSLETFAVHPTYLSWLEMGAYSTFQISTNKYDVGRFTLTSTSSNIPSYIGADSSFVPSPETLVGTGYGCDGINGNGGQKQYAYFDLSTMSEFIAFSNATLTASKFGYFVQNLISIADPLTGPELCKGDSGGPLYRWDGADWLIAAIAHTSSAGLSAWARYSDVQNWLDSPVHNDFSVGSSGFIYNQWNRSIVSSSSNASVVWEGPASQAGQTLSTNSWTLTTSGVNGAFYLKNGATGKCLDLAGSTLVASTCLAPSQTPNTQQWFFVPHPVASTTTAATGLYRRIHNLSDTTKCVTASDPGAGTSALTFETCTTAAPPWNGTGANWRRQAWFMSR